jgi:hypothetical protein
MRWMNNKPGSTANLQLTGLENVYLSP